MFKIEELTEEQKVQKAFNAAMDSVNLIKGGKPEGVSDEEWADIVARNKEHLELMVAKDVFTKEQNATLSAAVAPKVGK